MNESESELENELRSLPPAPPSPRLAAAIARRLEARPTSRAMQRALWLSWSLTAAAAAAAVVAWWPASATAGPEERLAPPVARADATAAVPVATSNVLTAARDEGLVLLEDGRAARRVRLHFVDTVRLHDPGAAAEIAVSRPREEVRFVPVSLY